MGLCKKLSLKCFCIGVAVNTEMLIAYWEIGKDIVEFEQGGKLKAEYGKALLVNLSKDLILRYGKGFSRVPNMCDTVTHIELVTLL